MTGGDNSGYRRGKPHSSRGKGAIEDGEGSATAETRCERPTDTPAGRKRGVIRQCQRGHEKGAAGMGEGCELEGVGAPDGVSSEEVTRAPGKN